MSSVEGEPLFNPALERLRNLYPESYTRGSTSTQEISDGLKQPQEVIELGEFTLPGLSTLKQALMGAYRLSCKYLGGGHTSAPSSY